MNRGFTLWVLLIVAALAVSCSGSSGNPVIPGSPDTDLTAGVENTSRGASSKASWGVWEININTETWEAEIIPLRGSQYTVDVVTFLQPPAGNPANLSLAVTDVSEWFTQGLITCEVGLRHPFPGLEVYTGFDVMGVFMAPGSVAGLYDADVLYTNGDDEPILLNADGYTRWMNPVEFEPNGTILAFKPGKLSGSPLDLFTSTINGYKYFADGLELLDSVTDFYKEPVNTDGRGKFMPGSYNVREYQLKFPLVDDSPQLVFQYAVVASWVEPQPELSGDPDIVDVPEDFPYSANADEAIHVGVADSSTLYFVDDVGGGDISLQLEVYDWGALQDEVIVPDEISSIIVEAAEIPGGYVEFDNTALTAVAGDGTSLISSVFNVDVSSVTPTSAEDVNVLISVLSSDPATFDPGTGIPNNEDNLAAYFLYPVPVGSEIPSQIEVISPNGGETLWMGMFHEITWDIGPGTTTDVKIEWSTDNFASDIRTIVEETENDGSYMWEPVPVEDTTTARIRISAVGGSDSDTSDADFEIALPVWLAFEDPVTVDSGTVTWGWTGSYVHQCDEISPAIMQTITGTSYVGFYGINVGSTSYDRMVRSANGSSWYGSPSFWSTGGVNYGRGDYCKVCPSHTGTGWMITSLWFSNPAAAAYGWWSDIARGNGGTYNYCFDGVSYYPGQDKYTEIMTDSSGYIWQFGDGGSPGIRYVKSNQPGLTGGGGPGQVSSAVNLVADGTISKSRAWARQGQAVALAFTNSSGEVRLAETADAPTNNTWETNEVIFELGTDYTSVSSPCLCADSDDRLFAAWVAIDTSGAYNILASMRENVNDPWSNPVVVTTSSSELLDVHISSQAVDLPTGTTEDVALVTWEEDLQVKSAISPYELLAFLPLQDASDSGIDARQPDSMCMDDSLGYLYDVLIAYSWQDGNWDIDLVHANFTTP